MTEHRLPPDQPQRERALATDSSFIVQAPAGSGKTELLTQRVLALLAGARQPEAILAMTFTRKAAAEMRQRVLQALRAGQGACPDAPHARTTWRLARAALERDVEQGWRLLDNPNRLRVQTIDGLCASLTRQMPLLSRLGGALETVDDTGALYLKAARETLRQLADPHIGNAVATLLGHLNNDLEKTAALIADLLARRDQWLGKLMGDNSRQVLEAALAASVRDRLQAAAALLPADIAATLGELAHYACAQKQAHDKPLGPLAAFLDRTAPPVPTPDDLTAWQAFAELCLTNTGSVRKSISVRDGFPPADKQDPRPADMKARMLGCLADLTELPALAAALDPIRRLPAPRLSDGQWQVLQALVAVLLRAAAELKLVFAADGKADFGEIHASALTALGDEGAPSALALGLDYAIQHILVDEFQDTSSGQYELLQRLTAGWQPGDGRTLFVVGDPMQSIYAFRQAEVGLYLTAREHGIGEIALEPLTLQANFRSRQGVVDWVNQAFPKVFPPQPDPASGAVTYSPSVAQKPADDAAAVHIHPLAGRDDMVEAVAVTRLIGAALRDDPEGSVAVLARSRGHLTTIAQQLRHAGVAYQAVDIDPLGRLPAVQDLHALLSALRHPADRLAWLTVLRSPLVGLTLADLLRLADGRPVPAQLLDAQLVATLSTDAQARLARVTPVLSAAMAQWRRLPLRDALLGTWRALGGEACVHTPAELAAVHSYLRLLAERDRGGELADPEAFEDALATLFAPADGGSAGRVQLMTMHKAKGLEFDTVILPGLGRAPRRDDKPLITWLERPRADGETDLLLAPIKPAQQSEDLVFDHIWAMHREKQTLESARLLYVACTRARRTLHLFGHAGFDARSGEPKASAGSLLATLWPAVAEHFADLAPASDHTPPADTAPPDLQRLPADWVPVDRPPPVTLRDRQASGQPTSVAFDWAGETARHVGTLVHRYLERIANEGIDTWSPERVAGLAPRLAPALDELGVPTEQRATAVERVTTLLQRTLADQQGRWILDRHRDARCEWALSEATANGVLHHVIDRSFVDEHGTRWIIDYKTGDHGGSDTDGFLAQERERYTAQLQGYARVLSRLEDRPIRLGLYYPALGGWLAWPYTP